MYECRLDISEGPGMVTALAEIRVLIYGAGDQAGYFGGFFGVRAYVDGEGGGECGGGLHSWKEEFGDVVAARCLG